MKQNTIAIAITGQGRHQREQRNEQFNLKPASENAGIVLRRLDLKHQPEFVLSLENLRQVLPSLATEYFQLGSFLPLFAVLRALRIDNIEIEVFDESMPSMGDNASSLLFLVRAAGLTSQNALRKTLVLKEACLFKASDVEWVRVTPAQTKQRIAILQSQLQTHDPLVVKDFLVETSRAMFVSQLCHARSVKSIDEQYQRAQSGVTCPQTLRASLQAEKGHRLAFNAYSLLSLLPYPLEVDLVFNNYKSTEAMAHLLADILGNDKIKVISDLSTDEGLTASGRTMKDSIAV